MILGFAGYVTGMVFDNTKTEQTTIDISIKGTVNDSTNNPVSGVIITIDAYNFRTTTNQLGEFMGKLKDTKIGEIIKLRTYHEKYKSFHESKEINGSELKYNIILKSR